MATLTGHTHTVARRKRQRIAALVAIAIGSILALPASQATTETRRRVRASVHPLTAYLAEGHGWDRRVYLEDLRPHISRDIAKGSYYQAQSIELPGQHLVLLTPKDKSVLLPGYQELRRLAQMKPPEAMIRLIMDQGLGGAAHNAALAIATVDQLQSHAGLRYMGVPIAPIAHSVVRARRWNGICVGYLMDYVPGVSLSEHIRRGSIDTQGIAAVLDHVEGQTRVLGDAGLHHGDLNPTNLVLAENALQRPPVLMDPTQWIALPGTQPDTADAAQLGLLRAELATIGTLTSLTWKTKQRALPTP